ncbi:4887_t:CDS:2 [Rhizophagus irregularis]|nr:4887_t:CDS:2 [Rhizophagus irregularis]
MNANEIPLINVPYPPELTVEEILSRRSEEKLRLRAPNQFFIYRLAYIKELRKIIGENISMTKISPQISSSWAREPPEIKQAYKNLSDLAENRLKEIRQNNSLVIIYDNNSSQPPPPPSTNNDIEYTTPKLVEKIIKDMRKESQASKSTSLEQRVSDNSSLIVDNYKS